MAARCSGRSCPFADASALIGGYSCTVGGRRTAVAASVTLLFSRSRLVSSPSHPRSFCGRRRLRLVCWLVGNTCSPLLARAGCTDRGPLLRRSDNALVYLGSGEAWTHQHEQGIRARMVWESSRRSIEGRVVDGTCAKTVEKLSSSAPPAGDQGVKAASGAVACRAVLAHAVVSPGGGCASMPLLACENQAEPRASTVCRRVAGSVEHAERCVFTSESYGDGFAAELTACFRASDSSASPVTHILVDQARREVPISASIIRENIHAHRHWLSPVVYADFVERICLLGGESSGKSTLAAGARSSFQNRPCSGIWSRTLGTARRRAFPERLDRDLPSSVAWNMARAIRQPLPFLRHFSADHTFLQPGLSAGRSGIATVRHAALYSRGSLRSRFSFHSGWHPAGRGFFAACHQGISNNYPAAISRGCSHPGLSNNASAGQ